MDDLNRFCCFNDNFSSCIVGEIDEKTFKSKLSREAYRISKDRRILQVFEILETVTIENFNEIGNALETLLQAKSNDLESNFYTDNFVNNVEKFLKSRFSKE